MKFFWRLFFPSIALLLIAAGPSSPTSFAAAWSGHKSAALAVPGDEFWDGRFNVLGVNGYVRAIAVSGTDVYVGGLFNSVGGVSANNVAKWDSATGTWSALGAGVSGDVHAIAVNGEEIYVGGNFLAAGGIPSVPGTQGIARWSSVTHSWTPLGSGVPGYVYAIAVQGSDVYAGGLFNAASGVGASNIARYNTTSNTWSALGNGVNGTSYKVFALAVSGNDVYVGGYFASAGNVPGTQSIARWNSTNQTWSAVGSGIGGYVYALAASGDDLYVGGLFNAVNGLPSVPNTGNIARWNRASGTWSALGSGVSSYVYSLAASGGEVYVGGLFNAAGGAANTYNIARWDGGSWSALGSGVGGYVYAIGAGADGVYAGGLFNGTGDKAAYNFGLWHGSLSSPPEPNDVYWDDRFGSALRFGTLVSDIEVNGNDVYVGGNFTEAGGQPGTRGLAKWNNPSGNWSSVGNGISNGRVETIAISGNDLYIGGNFTSGSGFPANYIARWDGNNWSALGSGVDGPVSDIEISGNSVYALGSFNNAGGQNALRIARWNSTTGEWSPLGTGLGFGPNDMAIRSDGSVIVVGITDAGGVPVNYVARWDGSSWSAFGSGLTCCVSTVEAVGSTVYIGGSFNQIDGAVANFLAMESGGSWVQVGSDLSGTVLALTVSSSAVYAGGSFDLAGGVSANRIAKWDGNNWSALGSGLNNSPFTLALADSELYVGGLLSLAGNKPSTWFGLWHEGPLSGRSGSIFGQVTGPGGSPVPGALVQACPTGGFCIWRGSTDVQGNYLATNLISGEYTLKVYPPAAASFVPASPAPLVLSSGESLTGQDVQLSGIETPPAGTSLTPGRIGGGGIPRVDWKAPLQLAAQGCSGGSASYQISQDGALLRSGSMTEGSAGQYLAGIPSLAPSYGYGSAAITIQCPGFTRVDENIRFTLYIDPSSVVRTLAGEPIAGAAVTLYSFDTESGDFAVVPDGDAMMSPFNRTNPDQTDGYGRFGWDAAAGYYKVRAEKAGCSSPADPSQAYVESDILVIQPPVSDLDLRLDCGINNVHIYLPLVHH